jgi:transposase
VADAAERLSSVHTVQGYFYDWRGNGLFESINFELLLQAREAVGREPSPVGGGHRQSIGQDDRERRAAWLSLSSGAAKPRPGGRGQQGQRPAPAKAGGCKRHIVTDTCGLLVGAAVHPADIQDRDGARLVIAAVRQLFPWLRHLFADSVYNGPNLRDALAKFGDWTIDIVKPAGDDTGFQLLPRRWVVEQPSLGSIETAV